MNDLDQLRQRLAEAQQKEQQLHEREQEALRRRDEAKKQAQRIRARQEEKIAEAEATALRPDHDGAAEEAVRQKAAELEERAAEREEEHERAKEAWEEAKRHRIEVARKLVPELAAEARDAIDELTEAYRQLVAADRPVPAVYRDRLLPARSRWSEVRRELQQAVSLAGAGNRQRREMRAYLKDTIREVSPTVRLRFLLADLLDWTRRGKSPAAEVWEQWDVPPREGSIRHQQPIRAPDDTVSRLQAGRLPIDMTL